MPFCTYCTHGGCWHVMGSEYANYVLHSCVFDNVLLMTAEVSMLATVCCSTLFQVALGLRIDRLRRERYPINTWASRWASAILVGKSLVGIVCVYRNLAESIARMASYYDSLKESEKERYCRKLCYLYGKSETDKVHSCRELDPYLLESNKWKDDVSSWPPVEFPHIYVYLIETPGEFTREKLKAFKSLEAYNYYSKWVSC